MRCNRGALSPCLQGQNAPTERGGYSLLAKHRTRHAPAAALFTTVLICFATSSFAQSRAIKLNKNAFGYAEELIAQGHVVSDKKNEWARHHPPASDENDFIREHGFVEYEKWHLGIDATHAQNTKAKYKFPFGDFKNIHRCGLLAVKSRAHQFGYSDIENAAGRLLEMMDARKQ